MNPASTKKHSFASLSLLLLFLLLAVAKLSAVIFPSPAFLAPDPVFRQFELRETIFIAAIAELAAAFVFLKLGNRQASYFASAWVITPILVYRISLLVTMSKSTCGCFGRLPNYLGLSNSTVNMTTLIILFYISFVTYWQLANKSMVNPFKSVRNRGPAGATMPLVAALIIAGPIQTASAQETIRISGRISHAYTSAMARSPVLEQSFVVYVNGSNWLIKTTPEPGTVSRKATEYSAAYYDGDSLFIFSKLADQNDFIKPLRDRMSTLEAMTQTSVVLTNPLLLVKLQQELKKLDTQVSEFTKRPPLSKNDSVGMVERAFYPVFDVSMASPLWFVYCSPSSLFSVTNSLVPMWYRQHTRFEKRTNAVLTACLTDTAGFIEKASFSRVGSTNLDAFYSALSSTNFMGTRFATHFQVKTFMGSSQVSLTEGFVKEMAVQQGAIPIDEFGTLRTTLDDHRFRSVPGVRRPLQHTDEPIQSVNQIKNTDSFKNAVRVTPYLEPKKRSPWLMAAILIAAISVPAAIMLRKWGHKGDQNEK